MTFKLVAMTMQVQNGTNAKHVDQTFRVNNHIFVQNYMKWRYMILHSLVIPLMTHDLFLPHNSSTTSGKNKLTQKPWKEKFPLEEVMLIFVGSHREY